MSILYDWLTNSLIFRLSFKPIGELVDMKSFHLEIDKFGYVFLHLKLVLNKKDNLETCFTLVYSF
jgi:hypothetical protein